MNGLCGIELWHMECVKWTYLHMIHDLWILLGYHKEAWNYLQNNDLVMFIWHCIKLIKNEQCKQQNGPVTSSFFPRKVEKISKFSSGPLPLAFLSHTAYAGMSTLSTLKNNVKTVFNMPGTVSCHSVHYLSVKGDGGEKQCHPSALAGIFTMSYCRFGRLSYVCWKRS